jgi:hypothetical protein
MPEPLLLPSGYGFRPLRPGELTRRGSILDTCAIWEAPRTRGPRRYVIAADVSDGLEQDASVVEVLRVGTIDEPTEQVAEYVSNQIIPAALAYIIQALGTYYRDEDGVEAQAAIEVNAHGLTTQDTLQLHLGYGHFYTWEYYDAADPGERYSRKIGWYTNPRTRPMLLSKLHAALTTVDPVTGWPDLLTHSPYLHNELKDFQTDGALWEAQASAGAHDDAVMATAIGNYVTWRLQGGEREPLEERRRLRSAQQAALLAASQEAIKPDWRNTACTAEEADEWVQDAPDAIDSAMYDGRRD